MTNLTATAPSPESLVCRCESRRLESLGKLLAKYQMRLGLVNVGQPIPGSHFGEPEAGLVGDTLYVRPDTPMHSALHECCHYICMDTARRKYLHTDAGGDYEEENGVCYLSILLSDFIESFNRQRMMQDMDSWGYSFRLGSASRWFNEDAEDARQWLIHHQIISKEGLPAWQLRGRNEQ